MYCCMSRLHSFYTRVLYWTYFLKQLFVIIYSNKVHLQFWMLPFTCFFNECISEFEWIGWINESMIKKIPTSIAQINNLSRNQHLQAEW